MTARGAGTVERTSGDLVMARLPAARLGAGVFIQTATRRISATVAGVGRGAVWLAPDGSIEGIAAGDRVRVDPGAGRCVLGFGALGRAFDGSGRPLDGGPALRGRPAPVLQVPDPHLRPPVTEPLWTGIGVIDGLLTLGRGTRAGIFGPPGSGKSTVLESMAAQARCDAVVVGLTGERGREAATWIASCNPRMSIVCATSDRSASERIRATEVAFAQAAVLRARGLHVLLIVDSLARYAHAQRERRTAMGETAGRGGYPPGVFADLARLVESAGTSREGSVTLLATVLPDGPGDTDPISEAARSLLDGHIVLSRERAAAARFPAIDVTASAIRTMSAVVSRDHADDAAVVRAAIARLDATRDARELGLQEKGDALLERAIAAEDAIERFRETPASGEAAVAALRPLALRLASGSP